MKSVDATFTIYTLRKAHVDSCVYVCSPLSVCLFVSVYQSICLYYHEFLSCYTCLSICLFIHSFVSVILCLSLLASVSPSACLRTFLSLCLSICHFINLFAERDAMENK